MRREIWKLKFDKFVDCFWPNTKSSFAKFICPVCRFDWDGRAFLFQKMIFSCDCGIDMVVDRSFRKNEWVVVGVGSRNFEKEISWEEFERMKKLGAFR